MRYAQGGGLTPVGRAKREAVRFEAADLLESGLRPVEVAVRLRVSERSVDRWNQALNKHGRAGLVSKGPGGDKCRLDEQQLRELAVALEQGPAAHGWVDDQRWTLARIACVIRELFGIDYTVRGVCYLLHRMGYSPQMPQHVPIERDQQQVATWVEETWPNIKG